MPLEHAEDLVLQNRCVALFEQLLVDIGEPLQETFKHFLRSAHQHQNIIAQFGRFPHRNKILNRESTATELAYLAKPGAGF